MSPRASLPGAAELFRSTGAPDAAARAAESAPATPMSGPARGAAEGFGTTGAAGGGRSAANSRAVRQTGRRMRPAADRMPSGRERHEEKITVYCSADELVDLETARLTLRAEHGMAVDRGRIVREAIAVVLADFEAKGETSILVRRLRDS